jgi:hypothetical protein
VLFGPGLNLAQQRHSRSGQNCAFLETDTFDGLDGISALRSLSLRPPLFSASPLQFHLNLTAGLLLKRKSLVSLRPRKVRRHPKLGQIRDGGFAMPWIRQTARWDGGKFARSRIPDQGTGRGASKMPSWGVGQRIKGSESSGSSLQPKSRCGPHSDQPSVSLTHHQLHGPNKLAEAVKRRRRCCSSGFPERHGKALLQLERRSRHLEVPALLSLVVFRDLDTKRRSSRRGRRWTPQPKFGTR